MIGNALLHFIKCNLGLETPHSQTTIAEQNTLAKYAKEASIAVEIGVYEGVNTVLLAREILPTGVLYGIDPFFKGKLGICYHEKIAKLQIKRQGLRSKVQFIPKLSFDAVNDLPNSIDFIFIDGDHSLEGIEKDWNLYSGRVKQGGIIALHDTSVPAHDATVRNLGSFEYFQSHIKYDKRFTILETVDSLNILKKLSDDEA